ncbi:MAG TPA: hypothetical protein PKA16_13530 [Ottowia sp.]|uniref:hypothetical protein n=1 Tax=Ottowia sp. TaxID=1898956 RepID=UPI002B7348FA|nr:hypothetical protein [Ottowia sp.]HMN22400.1 hypothetical protein [Ottowia sp.]
MTAPVLRYPAELLRRATRMFATVAKIMLPVMLAVYVAERLGLVALAGRGLAPVMGMLGLPPEAAIIWATTVLTNLYGGIAIVATLASDLQLSVAQTSALGAMMLFAHNLPTEQAIVRKAGGSALLTGSLRLLVGAGFGAAVTWTCQLADWLQQPVSLAWLQGVGSAGGGTPDAGGWLLATAQSMGMIWLIIIALVLLLDALEWMGATRLFTRLLDPVLRLTGLEAHAAPLTTVGLLMGLTYGGALIIDASQREHYSRRTLLLATCWLSLFHSVIEDTLLIAALGASIWVILVVRGAITLAIMIALAALTLPHTRWGRRLAA